MQIKEITPELCDIQKEAIATFIYLSMNHSTPVEWYSKAEAVTKCLQLKSFIEEGNAIAFLAMQNDTALGFIWAYPYPDRGDEDRVYISIVYVDEKCRGLHVGEQMIKAVELEAKKRGYSKIWLHTNGNNNNAIKFYNKVGFTQERVQFVKQIED